MSSKKQASSGDEGFTKKHETLWQFIKFSLFSSLAGIVETVSFFIFTMFLPEKLPGDFDFFVFHYTNEKGLCLGAFIAFFVSAILAEIVSFLINRKATFNANNNFLKSAIGYLILVLVVISLKTWIVTVLTPLVTGWTAGMGNESLATLVNEWVPKACSMLLAVVIIFPMNKFVIMRHKD